MRKDRSLGIVLPTVFLLAGSYLLHQSTTHSQWYLDFYLIAGATISAMGLIMGFWAIQPNLPVRKLEQHARKHR